MTGWLGFIFRSAPWPWKILLSAGFPLWSFRARRIWPYSAAWTQRYGSRVAIGVKPPRLIETSQRSAGAALFEREIDSQEKIQHVTCHELVHACSAYLALPAWLNEGIAMQTVDQYLGKQTIRPDTLVMVKECLPKAAPPTYRSLSRMSLDAIAYHAARAYWIVRFLEETRPGLIKQLFTRFGDGKSIEQEIVQTLEVEPGSFWLRIDDDVADYFGGKEMESS